VGCTLPDPPAEALLQKEPQGLGLPLALRAPELLLEAEGLAELPRLPELRGVPLTEKLLPSEAELL
jgi:hypothetical protein